MQIYVINLDRKPLRWQRMAGLLQGLNFTRIAAVDGQTLDGPEKNRRPYGVSPADLSRYHRGCVRSHRAAYQQFLASPDAFGCVLEDDVFLSPDFARFINDTSWIPRGCDLMRIETTRLKGLLGHRRAACLDRHAAVIHSLQLGTAGYVISRRAAETLLQLTAEPVRAIDRIVYGKVARQRLHPVYQLIPALCIQGSHRGDGTTFPEMESSIQMPAPENVPPAPRLAPVTTETSRPIARPSKTVQEKVTRELARPFQQIQGRWSRLARATQQRLRGTRLESVPFA